MFRKIIFCLSLLGILVTGMVFAESKKQEGQTKPIPRIEKLGKVLFLEIIVDNKDNIPKELLPTGVKKIRVEKPPEEIKYNGKEKKVLYIEPPHFTTLLRKQKKYTYKALVKRVIKGAGPKRDEIYTDSVACFELPKKIGNIEIVSYTKDGSVNIKYGESKQGIKLRFGESWISDVVTTKVDPLEFFEVKDIETFAQKRRMDITRIRQLIPKEGFQLSTQTKITNYGIVNLEVEMYE